MSAHFLPRLGKLLVRSLPREPRGLRGVQELLVRALLRLSRLLLRALQLLLRPPLLERSQHRHLLRRARWARVRIRAWSERDTTT